MKKKIFSLFLIFSFLVTAGFGCKGDDKETKQAMQPITLTYWRVFDGPDAFADSIAKYNSLHKHINIEYRKLRYEEYEKELINALAEDRGPDIFSIPSTWIKEYETKIAPMPTQIPMVFYVVKGGIKKEVVPELRTKRLISLKELKDNFVDIIYEDVVLQRNGENKIYGLPLYIDTLAMFYNKDLINNAGITEPPKYWDKQFQQSIKKLTKQDNKGRLIQSGVAMGGGENIERSADILSLLMMQSGSKMMEGNTVLFNKIPPGYTSEQNPGLAALRFYTDFSNPAKEVYCWNNNLANSLDLFTQGKLAIMFGYAYHLPLIKVKAPKLNFEIAKVPQIKGSTKQINYANYWVETVSAKSKHVNESWDFINFITEAEQAKTYLDITKKPTALRALIPEQVEDLEIEIFANQILTAKSWYKGHDIRTTENVMDELINLVVSGEMKLTDALGQAASKVQQTVKN